MRKDTIERGKRGRFLYSMVEMEGRTCLACRLGQLAAERHWRSLAPRHAPRASVSPTAITKNSATANAVALFLAGAEGLEPSARGFGVDVGKCSKEQGRAGVARILPQARKGAVLVWCWEEIIRAKTGEKERKIPGKAGNTLTEIDTVRIIKNAGITPGGRLLQTGG